MNQQQSNREQPPAVDLEALAATDQAASGDATYRLRIDKGQREVGLDRMTGRQILGLVGKNPEKVLTTELQPSSIAFPK